MPMHQRPAKAPARRRVSREALLDAALELFLQHGFAATRVEDVACRAGVSKGSVYLHFKNKNELFQAVIDQGVVARLEQAEQHLVDFSGTASELLQTMLAQNLLEFWNSPFSGIQKLIVAESHLFPELAASYYQRITLRARRLLERVLQLGIDRGAYRTVDVAYVARCILNSLDQEIITRHLVGTGETSDFDPARYITTMLNLIQHGINATPDDPHSNQSAMLAEKQRS
jgi:TetR/AcrR family transcriptional regulator